MFLPFFPNIGRLRGLKGMNEQTVYVPEYDTPLAIVLRGDRLIDLEKRWQTSVRISSSHKPRLHSVARGGNTRDSHAVNGSGNRVHLSRVFERRRFGSQWQLRPDLHVV